MGINGITHMYLFLQGEGKKLGDISKSMLIPYSFEGVLITFLVADMFESTKADNEGFHTLHRLVFGRPGKVSFRISPIRLLTSIGQKKENIKKSLREFSGFVYTNKEADSAKLRLKLGKMFLPELKSVCHILALQSSGPKVCLLRYTKHVGLMV